MTGSDPGAPGWLTLPVHSNIHTACWRHSQHAPGPNEPPHSYQHIHSNILQTQRQCCSFLTFQLCNIKSNLTVHWTCVRKAKGFPMTFYFPHAHFCREWAIRRTPNLTLDPYRLRAAQRGLETITFTQDKKNYTSVKIKPRESRTYSDRTGNNYNTITIKTIIHPQLLRAALRDIHLLLSHLQPWGCSSRATHLKSLSLL